jgi:sulfonate transport system substrate-binding protein
MPMLIWVIAFTFLSSVIGSFYLPGATLAQGAKPDVIRLDYAYYNPVSLVLKEKGWLEKNLAKDNIKVEWVLSQGSNKALEFLNARSLDFGSTAGAAALIGRANGNPIKAVYVYSKPEWTALVTKSGSSIRSIQDLKGKRVAATRGTDPFIFLLRALDKVGLTAKDIEVVPLQHADGRAALERGDVAAWAGLDPHMARSEIEQKSRLFFREPKFNSFGILNVREDFARQYPSYIQRVLAAYETARKWSLANPQALREVLVNESKLTDVVAAKQLERTDLRNSRIGEPQRQAILAAGRVLKEEGVIAASVDIPKTVNDLIDPKFLRS